MADQDKKFEVEPPEKRTPGAEQPIDLGQEKEVQPEAGTFQEEQLVSKELRREIELMELDEGLRIQAQEKAKKIQFLGEEEKIEHLLKLAQEKGVVFAVKVAKSMNDPYILDTLHDILAREGYYKDFKF